VFFDGLTLNVTNPATANASYTIQPTREVARNLALNISIAADPRLIAAASPVRAEVTQTNTGTGKIELLTVQDGFAWPNNTPPLTVSYDGTTNTLSFANVPAAAGANGAVTAAGTSTAFALPGPVAYTPDAVITIGGLSFRISGAPKNLDTFTVARNVNGVADSRNALLLGRLQTQDTMAGGKTSFQGAYGQLVSDVGNKTREVQVTGEAQKALLEQAIAAREAQSGVNLDEEAANLIRYQQAYQAAARVIDVGSRLFDVLIGIGA
jgi:flagellar hook-associated protein 1 FlgK